MSKLAFKIYQQFFCLITEIEGSRNPIGIISAWTPFPDARKKNISAQLPDCYVHCDGSEITLGIWKGHRTPDLNNAKRFLRGGSVSNALKVEEDSLQEHTHYHTLTDDGHTHGFTDRYVGGNSNGEVCNCPIGRW